MAEVTRQLYDSLLLDGYAGLPEYDSFKDTLRTNGDARLQLYKSLKNKGFSGLPEFVVFNNDFADSSQVLGPLRMGRTGRTPDVVREYPPRDNIIQPPITTESPDLPQRSAWQNALTRGLIDMGVRAGDLMGSFYGEKFREQHRINKAEFERRKTQPVYSLRQVGEKWKSEGVLGAAKELGGFVLESGLESAPMIGLAATSPTAFYAVLNEMYAADIAEKEGLTEQGWVERLKAIPITTVVGILERLGIKNRRGSTGVGSVLKRTGVEQGKEFGEGSIEEAGTSVMAGQPVSLPETLWKGLESSVGTTLPNLSLEAGSPVVDRTDTGHRVADAIDAQVDNATPLPQQPAPNVRQGQAPSIRTMLEAELNKKGYTLLRSRENFSSALGLRPLLPDGSTSPHDPAVAAPRYGSADKVISPDVEQVGARKVATPDVEYVGGEGDFHPPAVVADGASGAVEYVPRADRADDMVEPGGSLSAAVLDGGPLPDRIADALPLSRVVGFNDLPYSSKDAIVRYARSMNRPFSEVVDSGWRSVLVDIASLRDMNSSLWHGDFARNGTSLPDGPVVIDHGVVLDGKSRIREAFLRGDKVIEAFVRDASSLPAEGVLGEYSAGVQGDDGDGGVDRSGSGSIRDDSAGP